MQWNVKNLRRKIMETKVNLELSLSKDYNKITIGMVEETIEYESDEELKAKIRQKMDLLKGEVELEFTKL